MYTSLEKKKNLSEGEEVVQGVSRRGMGCETSCLHKPLESEERCDTWAMRELWMAMRS